MAAEYAVLMDVLAAAPDWYHELLVRQRRLLSDCSLSDIVTVLSFADGVAPGVAEGAPLRAVAWPGADTKLFKRNRALLVALLDVRFDGQVSKLGLERFLDAAEGGGHWLLVADLDGELLRYPRLRLTETDLERYGLPGDRMLAVENEQCFHMLPSSPGTVAVLGAGLNTRWLASSTFDSHRVGYWGDLDTWGLKMLADARTALNSLMMDRITFDTFASRAVPEPQRPKEPIGLASKELELFRFLGDLERGRLEQELLPASWVADAVASWR